LENSASAPTSATVVGVSFMPIATSKKPSLIEALPCGPYGMVWKKRGVLELVVDGQAQHAEHHLPLHGDRHRRHREVRAVGDDEIHFVDVKQLGVDGRHVGRIDWSS
jgi:hypothetical protein